MTAKLRTLPQNADSASILNALDADGAVIVSDLIDSSVIGRLRAELQPYINRTPVGRDEFTGRSTRRTGALVARAPTSRELVTDRRVLDPVRTFLAPYTERILLHLTQSILIEAGEGAQTLHRDRLAWGTHLPLSIEPQLNTMWAIDDFTQDNGATRVVPGSHRWSWDRRAEPQEKTCAEMAAGSVLFYTGSVLHSGGLNESSASRLGVNITYCLGWLRQEENQYLSCPPEVARDLEPELQELLGYTQGNYALGYYSDPYSDQTDKDLLPPEMALGRWPREAAKFSLSSDAGDGAGVDYLREEGAAGG